MRKFCIRGVVFFAGVLSIPTPVSSWLSQPRVPNYWKDTRLEKLRGFFRRFGCPAQAYAPAFLEAADRYSLDWRLLPSISFVESTGGKALRNNNMFGWDSGNAEFPTPTAGIHTVGYRLAHSGRYRNLNLDEKLAMYNPNPGYARKVKSVMRSIALAE